MAKLERLGLSFNAMGWDMYGAAPAGIEHLSGLKEISIEIGCNGAKESNRRAAESALRNAVDMHPGYPTTKITCRDNFRFFFDDSREGNEEREHLPCIILHETEESENDEEGDASCST
ncbi:hypothetical protein ACP4OV_023298 [Aristida adscensionis]